MTIRIEWRDAGLRELRYMDPTVRMLEEKGERVTAKANTFLPDDDEYGYMMRSRPAARRPYGRHQVTVAAVSIQARRSEARNNTLLRLLSGGGA